MTITRNKINGSWIISTLVNDNGFEYLETQTYIGYTKAEAKDLFLKHLASLIVKEFSLKQ